MSGPPPSPMLYSQFDEPPKLARPLPCHRPYIRASWLSSCAFETLDPIRLIALVQIHTLQPKDVKARLASRTAYAWAIWSQDAW